LLNPLFQIKAARPEYTHACNHKQQQADNMNTDKQHKLSKPITFKLDPEKT